MMSYDGDLPTVLMDGDGDDDDDDLPSCSIV